MKTITIEIPDGKKAEWVNGVLTLVDDKPQDPNEQIKSFEDAADTVAFAGANISSKFCFKTHERAMQFGKQFIDLWNDLLR